MPVVETISAIIGVISAIKDIADQVEHNKLSCGKLAGRLDQTKPSLDRLTKSPTSFQGTNSDLEKLLVDFQKFIDEIKAFMSGFKDKNYLQKLLGVIGNDKDGAVFAEYNQRLTQLQSALQLGILADMASVIREYQDAYQEDYKTMAAMMRAFLDAQKSDSQTMSDIRKKMDQNHQINVDLMQNLTIEMTKSEERRSNKFTDAQLEQIKELIGGTVSSIRSSSSADKYRDLKYLNLGDLGGSREVKDLIGDGSFCILFRGKYRDSIDVAIKTVKPALLSEKGDDAVRDAIKREAMIMQLLAFHPGIIRFIGVELLSFSIVMELATCSLEKVLYDPNYHNAIGNEHLNLSKKVAVICSICDTMDYIHGLHVIHRDIKPCNILVVNGVPKLADFGLAKNTVSSSRSSTAGIKGTYPYMAPEIFDEPIVYDEYTDVYAFAVTINEILAGKRPFEDMDDVKIMRLIVKSDGKARPEVFNKGSEHVSASAGNEISINSGGESSNDKNGVWNWMKSFVVSKEKAATVAY